MANISTQRSYRDPQLIEPLFDLFETSFSGIGRHRKISENMGVPWEAGSTPFVLFQDDQAVSHVGVLEIPVIVLGKSLTVGGIHAVCTRPEYRRRGYFHRLMSEALAFCDSRHETLVLFTAQPSLYEPFGFRTVRERIFKLDFVSFEYPGGHPGDFRPLDKEKSNDVQILHRLIETRSPVSKILGIQSEKGVFFFDEALRPLYYSEKLDVVISMELEGSRLHLFDIVGPKVFSLEELIHHLGHSIQEVWIYFSPDQLGVKARSEPHILEEDSNLMVRGPFPPETSEFMWPRSGRC